MSNIYKGDVGVPITILTGNTSLPQADTYALKVVKPSGATAEWALEAEDIDFLTGIIIRYSQDGELEESGDYQVQIKHTEAGTGNITHSDVDNLKVLKTLW
jgi:hypothetical protein